MSGAVHGFKRPPALLRVDIEVIHITGIILLVTRSDEPGWDEMISILDETTSKHPRYSQIDIVHVGSLDLLVAAVAVLGT